MSCLSAVEIKIITIKKAHEKDIKENANYTGVN